MLNKVRQPFTVKNLVAYVIFGTICLTFVFIGLGGNQGLAPGGGRVAVVNGSPISMITFRQQAEQQEERLRQFLSSLPAARRREESRRLRLAVVDQLIEEEVLFQSSEELGLTTSDEEILDMIVNAPIFQGKGRFQQEMYDRFLKIRRYSPEAFEKTLRKSQTANKLRRSFLMVLGFSNLEDQKEKELDRVRLKLKFVSLSREDIRNGYKPSSQEITPFIEKSTDQIQKYYETHSGEFSSPEQVRARHILIKAKRGDKKQEAEALIKVMAYAQMSAKEDFGELAEKFSEDPGSREKKGDLGYFSRGQMMPEFEQAAFEGKVGEVSEPIQTDYGYHIIKVEDKKGEEKKELSAVKELITRKLMAENAVGRIVEDLREKLQAKDVSGVSRFINNYGLDWEETGTFSIDRDPPKIGRGDEIYQALFRSGKKGEILPELIESGGAYYIVKLLDLQKLPPPKEQPKQEKRKNIWALGGRGVQETLKGWIGDWQEKAQVQINHQSIN